MSNTNETQLDASSRRFQTFNVDTFASHHIKAGKGRLVRDQIHFLSAQEQKTRHQK